jgi:transposase
MAVDPRESCRSGSDAQHTLAAGGRMIILGVDAHKQVHAAVALDDAGRELGRWRGANTAAGWAELAEWASGFGAARRWGIEGAWSYGRGLAQHLVAVGEEVYEINPRWTAEQRRRGRRRDKTDALDARAVALLVWREASALPRVQGEDETAVLDLLVTEREGAIAEATRLRNQLHDLLLHLDPDYGRSLRTLESAKALAVLEQYTAPRRIGLCLAARGGPQSRATRPPADAALPVHPRPPIRHKWHHPERSPAAARPGPRVL